MKFFGIILVFVSGVLLVWKMAGEYFSRIKILKGLISDFELLKNEILFKKTTLYEGLEQLSEVGKRKEFHKNALKGMKSGNLPEEAFYNACGVFKENFTEEDKIILSDFAAYFRNTDMEGEKNAFENLINRLEISLAEAEKNKNEKLKPKCAVVLSGFFILGIFLI